MPRSQASAWACCCWERLPGSCCGAAGPLDRRRSAIALSGLQVSVHIVAEMHIADRRGMEHTGVGRYAVESVRALCAARPDWRFTILSNRDLVTAPNAHVIRTRWPTERSAARVAWLQVGAAIEQRGLKPDLWLGTAFTLPWWWRGRSVVTIHDLMFLEMRSAYSGRVNAAYASTATRLAARRAARVICGSRETAERLGRHWAVEPEKVEVMPYGVSDVFFTEHPLESAKPPYLLFVGTFEARKGLDALHRAMEILTGPRGRDVRLVMAGRPGWGVDDLLATLEAHPRVDLRISPSDEELASLYRSALAVVHPSRAEGFGLPVAEAMASGAPVIATGLECVREFAGDVPRYVAVDDADGIADHVERLMDDPDEQAERGARGMLRSKDLSWSAVGRRTAGIIEEVLS